jgi:hypothetical protein
VTVSVRVDPASNAALYVLGDEFVLDVAWVDKAGAVQPIDDTAEYVATIFRAGGETIASVSHEPAGDPAARTARFSFPLAIAEALAGQRGVYVALQQLVSPGPPPRLTTFYTFNLPVRQLAGAIAPTGGLAPRLDAPTLIEISPGGVTIMPRGPSGPSAAQQLASARDPATGLPYINEPTVDEMAGWLRDHAGSAAAEIVAEVVEETAEQALYAKSQGDYAKIQAERLTQGLAYLFDIVPVEGKDRTVEIATLAATQPTVRFAPGDYIISGALPVIFLLFKAYTRLVGDGRVRFLHRWTDPASLGAVLECRGGDYFAAEGIIYEPQPRLDTQGRVSVIEGDTFYFAAQPGLEPQWAPHGADNLIGIEEDTAGGGDREYYALGSKYKVAGVSRPFPIEPVVIGGIHQTDTRGWKVYKASPLDDAINPTAILSYNPLIVSVRPQDWVDPENGVGDRFTGVLATILNGRRCTFEPVDPDASFIAQVYVFDEMGLPIDASAATGEAPGAGAFLSPAIPTWVTVGSTIVLQCRKRGANPFYCRGTKSVLLDLEVRGAMSVPCHIWDFDRLHLELRGGGDGYLAANGGPVNVFAGKRITGNVRWRGSGDDVFAPRGMDLRARIVRYDLQHGWFDADLFRIGDAHVKKAAVPDPGELLEFVENDLTKHPRRVELAGVSPDDPAHTRVWLTGGLPNDFDPATWSVLNRSRVPEFELDELHSIASSARVLLPYTHKGRIRRLTAIGTAYSVILALCPFSRAGGVATLGFGGELVIDVLETRRVSSAATFRRNRDQAAVIARAAQIDYTPVTRPTGWRIVIGEWIADEFPFSLVHTRGVEVIVLKRTIRNGGTRRPVNPPEDTDNFDWVAADYGRIALGGDNVGSGYRETFLEGTGGYVDFTNGSLLQKAGTLLPGAIEVQAAKKVRPGDETKVELRIGGVVQSPGSYLADGTATLRLRAPAITSGPPIACSVTHTGN